MPQIIEQSNSSHPSIWAGVLAAESALGRRAEARATAIRLYENYSEEERHELDTKRGELEESITKRDMAQLNVWDWL